MCNIVSWLDICVWKEQHPRAGLNTQQVLDEQQPRAGWNTQPTKSEELIIICCTCKNYPGFK